MNTRSLPVRPNLSQLRHQAKDLLDAFRKGEPDAAAELAFISSRRQPKLADAQLALARSYGAKTWSRVVLACNLIDAIWENRISEVRAMVLKNPFLIHEDARIVPCNWGPPMAYAANVGRTEIVQMLHELGATDVQQAFVRACLRGQLGTARELFRMGARPERGIVMGPCETLNPDGLAFQLELGAEVCDEEGNSLAPLGLILQTYTRNADGKHRCLRLLEDVGQVYPDTPPMAVHRGRQDLLERHLARDPDLFRRTYSHEEIYPPTLGCSADHNLALHGTPLDGGTLLHLCVDYDEFELANWMISKGADVDAPAAIDADGFGGHTALFGTIVSQPHRANVAGHERFARLLLENGANPRARASLRKELRFVDDESLHEYRDVSVVEWGERFHDHDWVNPAALKLVRAAI